MNFTDTHTHLYAAEFDADRESLIRHAIDEGVTRFYMPNIDTTSIEPMLRIENQFPKNCFSMMGLHPCSVKEDFQKQLKEIEEVFRKNKFVAVGEIGIDLYWDKTFLNQQREAFIIQCGWAVEKNLPVVIHTRNSFAETLDIVAALPKIPRGIFHCFSGTLEQAKQVIEMGFYLGIGGVLTFKNSGLDKLIEHIDIKHLVLETDAPYLAPVPFRSKRNEPRYLKLVAEKLSEVKKITLEEVARITSLNAENIFHNP